MLVELVGNRDLAEMLTREDVPEEVLREAASRIIDLTEEVEECREDIDCRIKAHEMFKNNPTRNAWVAWWRKSNGYDDLHHPGNITVYAEFFKLAERNEDLEMMVADLKTLNKSLKALIADSEGRDVVCCQECKYGMVDWPWSSPSDEVNYCEKFVCETKPHGYCSWGEKDELGRERA